MAVPFRFRPRPSHRHARSGFTLVELMLSMVLLLVLMSILFSILAQVSTALRYSNSKIDEFASARAAFNQISNRLAQVTLNPYWDTNTVLPAYINNPGSTPVGYIRQSELRFISGQAKDVIDSPSDTGRPHPTDCVFFNAPLGMVDTSTNAALKNLINTSGFFIEYSSDAPFLPDFLAKAMSLTRFRLMELDEPSENLSIYQYTSGLTSSDTGAYPTTNSYCTAPSLPGLTNGTETFLNGTCQIYTPGSYNGREWFLNSYNNWLSGSSSSVHILADDVIALVILPKLSQTKDPTGAALCPNYNYDSTGTSSSPVVTATVTAGDLQMVNRLPPILEVSVVCIDRASASRMTDAQATALQGELAGLFTDSSKFQDDLHGTGNSLEQYLIKNHIDYRIFTTDIQVKEAKWSRD